MKVIAVVSCLFVVVSTLCLIFSTLPRFQKKDKNGVIRKFVQINSGKWTISLCIIFFLEEEYFFEIAEAVFVGWFTFEYVIRFIAAPRKME